MLRLPVMVSFNLNWNFPSSNLWSFTCYLTRGKSRILPPTILQLSYFIPHPVLLEFFFSPYFPHPFNAISNSSISASTEATPGISTPGRLLYYDVGEAVCLVGTASCNPCSRLSLDLLQSDHRYRPHCHICASLVSLGCFFHPFGTMYIPSCPLGSQFEYPVRVFNVFPSATKPVRGALRLLQWSQSFRK